MVRSLVENLKLGYKGIFPFFFLILNSLLFHTSQNLERKVVSSLGEVVINDGATESPSQKDWMGIPAVPRLAS